jgi:opacity protein-like surface antigen
VKGSNVTTSKSLLTLAALAAAISAAPTAAHHSFAMFDQTKQVTLKGKVAQFQWTNPHAFIELNVPNAQGGEDRWSIELNSPNNLTRQGWRRSSLKPGDNVTLTFNPLRNGKKGGLFNRVVLPNGSVLGDPSEGSGRPINVPTAN